MNIVQYHSKNAKLHQNNSYTSWIVLLTLPKRDKNDGFDDEKLEDGLIRCKELFCSKVEEKEGVQRQANWYIIDDRDVQVTIRNSECENECKQDEK